MHATLSFTNGKLFGVREHLIETVAKSIDNWHVDQQNLEVALDDLIEHVDVLVKEWMIAELKENLDAQYWKKCGVKNFVCPAAKIQEKQRSS